MQIKYCLAYDSETIYECQADLGLFDTLEEAINARNKHYEKDKASYECFIKHHPTFRFEKPRLYEIYKITTEKVG